MARSYTIAELKTRIKRAADFENSNFIGDAELLDIINNAYADLYSLLVAKDENYYSSTSTFTIGSGSVTYSLPSDFFKILAVEFQVSTDKYVTIKPYNEAEKNSMNITTSLPSGTVRLRYVPLPTKFTLDAQTVDGIAGWEEYIVISGAIQCLIKEETDTTALERRLARLERRIEDTAQNRDMLFAGSVGDVYRQQYPTNLYSMLRYRLYGGNIEFISTEAIAFFAGF